MFYDKAKIEQKVGRTLTEYECYEMVVSQFLKSRFSEIVDMFQYLLHKLENVTNKDEETKVLDVLFSYLDFTGIWYEDHEECNKIAFYRSYVLSLFKVE